MRESSRVTLLLYDLYQFDYKKTHYLIIFSVITSLKILVIANAMPTFFASYSQKICVQLFTTFHNQIGIKLNIRIALL